MAEALCSGKSVAAVPAALALWLLPPAFADVPPEQKHEVAHLLSFVRYAECQMIRNGVAHGSREGYRHVLEKYDYFRDRIQSTEEFIDLVGARSLLSGEDYLIVCGEGAPEASAVWLHRELGRYRRCMEAGVPQCGAEGAGEAPER